MKRKINKAFTLIEVVVAISIFALSSTMLVYSLFNGINCKRSRYSVDNFKERYHLISQIVNSTHSKSELESIHHVTLPNKGKMKIDFQIDPTETEFLYAVNIKCDDKPAYKLYVANKNWQDD